MQFKQQCDDSPGRMAHSHLLHGVDVEMSIQSLTVTAYLHPFLTLFVGDPDSYGHISPAHGLPSFLACLN